MKCPNCRSMNVSKKGFRHNNIGKKQRYLCNKCKSSFIKKDGFERMRHNKKVIARAIHMHNDGLSLFQVQNHLWQHDGVKVSRETIREWGDRYSVFLK
jgi:transposase-like protein